MLSYLSKYGNQCSFSCRLLYAYMCFTTDPLRHKTFNKSQDLCLWRKMIKPNLSAEAKLYLINHALLLAQPEKLDLLCADAQLTICWLRQLVECIVNWLFPSIHFSVSLLQDLVHTALEAFWQDKQSLLGGCGLLLMGFLNLFGNWFDISIIRQ